MYYTRKKRIAELLASFGKIKSDEDFNLNLVAGYFSKRKNNLAYVRVSERTCNDLDLNDFFMFADRTSSRVGQQYLYCLLRSIPLNGSFISNHENLIDEFVSNKAFRINSQLLLGKLNRFEAYYIESLFQDKHIERPKWYYWIKLSSFASLLSVFMLFVSAKFIFPVILLALVNLGVHYWNKRNLVLYVGALPQLVRLLNVANRLHSNGQLASLNPNLEQSVQRVRSVCKWLNVLGLNKNIHSDIGEAFMIVTELIKAMFLIEVIGMYGAIKRIEVNREPIEALFTFVGQVDALISVASLRAGATFCIPEVLKPTCQLHMDKIYHPLIDNCVCNSLNISGKSVLLTGSNMSGKTSFIRAVGINVISSLALNTAFAEHFATPILQVQSAIRISDDLLNDRSYYFEEVLAIKQMVESSVGNIPVLFLLDEIFKGTNTIERIASGKAVLSYLAAGNNIVIVSTHDIELADLLVNEYELYHFSEVVNNATVDFDYKLKEGKLTTRNAIRILQINGYPASIIDEASSIAAYRLS